MDFNISEESQKKLDEMICGFVRTEEGQKEIHRMKKMEHLMEYHFRTFDEIVDYLKLGGLLLFEDVFNDSEINEGIIYNDETGLIELWKNDKSKIDWDKRKMSVEEFKDVIFFALMDDGSGFIKLFHRDLRGLGGKGWWKGNDCGEIWKRYDIGHEKDW